VITKHAHPLILVTSAFCPHVLHIFSQGMTIFYTTPTQPSL